MASLKKDNDQKTLNSHFAYLTSPKSHKVNVPPTEKNWIEKKAGHVIESRNGLKYKKRQRSHSTHDIHRHKLVCIDVSCYY